MNSCKIGWNTDKHYKKLFTVDTWITVATSNGGNGKNGNNGGI